MANVNFNGVKVFSATKMQERAMLGEKITEWLKLNPGIEIVDKIVTQSSDSEFHCLAITLFYKGQAVNVADTTAPAHQHTSRLSSVRG